MSRYFIEVCYQGGAYAGFQVQRNAVTVQAEVERAMRVFFREEIGLTGSSRTDSGVHAIQNYFHFDFEGEINDGMLYNLNSILATDIAVRSLRKVAPGSHCRFDAIWRQYRYVVYGRKEPFLRETAYYFPYRVDPGLMMLAAEMVRGHRDFRVFAKRNMQVKTFDCMVIESVWQREGGCMIYRVRANRFLRGMVRGLVGTMLLVGRGKMALEHFAGIMEGVEPAGVDFSVPGHGLCLERVEYPRGYFG